MEQAEYVIDNRGESMTYHQQRLGDYDYYEVLSAFRKEIVLGRTEDAIFWLTVLLTYSESGAKTAAKQLWVIASEVVDDDMCVLRAFAVYQLAGKITETDHLYHLTAKMCRSPKWFETAEGVSVDYLWSKSLGDLKNHPKPIPSYARDEHTSFGARAKKAGRPIDNRFSGHDFGRQQTKWMYDRDLKVSPDEYPDPQFHIYWKQYQELLGEQDEPVQQPLLAEAGNE
jgi:replication-associated recombination protein RarA